jgi:hypothetical protein
MARQHVSSRSTNLAGTLPPYEELKAQHFPLSKLSTEHLSPVGVMPVPPNPVFAAQANFIQGGLLLAVAVHHSASDGAGLDTIISTWAKNTAIAASTNGPFTAPSPLSNDRTPLMTGTPGANLANFPEFTLLPTPKPAAPIDMSAYQLPPMTSHIFHFPPASLAAVKTTAAAHSTNDALLALLWTHMVKARNHPPAGATSVLCLAADIRARAAPPLPATYLGNASMPVLTRRFPAADLLAPASGLRDAAAAIRASVDALGAPDRVAKVIGLIGSREDPSDYKYSYNAFLGPDVVASSWTRFGVYDRAWGGGLGMPEALRVPGEGADGIVMVLPQLRDGGLEVLVGLEDGAMGRLLGDAGFLEVATLWA